MGKRKEGIEIRCQKSEDRGQRTEGKEKDEHRTSNIEHRMMNEKTEGKGKEEGKKIRRLEGKRAEDGRQRSEVRGQRAEGKEEGKKIRRLEGQEKDEHRTSNVQHRMMNEKTEDGRQRSEVGGQRLEGKRKEEIGKREGQGFGKERGNGEKQKEIGGRKTEENKPLFREDGIRKFQGYFQRALALAPRQWKKAVERTWAYFPDDSVVMGIVPENDDNMKSRVLKYLATRAVSEPAKAVGK